jgi:hypothetical protein
MEVGEDEEDMGEEDLQKMGKIMGKSMGKSVEIAQK